MKLSRHFIPFLISCLLFSACTLEIEVKDISSQPADFLLSSIVSTTRGVSDGITELLMTIELKNSDGSFVEGFTPEISIISGIPATFVGCSPSNAAGISVCSFRSSTPGLVTVGTSVGLSNALIELTEDLIFEAPQQSGSFVQIVSSALNNVDANGYTVTSHIGAPVKGLRQVVNGYVIYTNTTSGITPGGANTYLRSPSNEEE